IDLSIHDTAVSLLVLGLARYFATGEEPVPGETMITGTFPFYALYETKDGRWLSVATVEPKFWVRMCELVGAPELADRQFAAAVPKRGEHSEEILRFLGYTSKQISSLAKRGVIGTAGPGPK